ncbi:helix-turn-helix domain-containing protein [Enterococcus italicus]|uniref:helix-turn-helix domain-containing protein n=1 Tax=Enterococcus italicus TaxID=246144 RepID=UPI0009000DC1|nr:helix-turn-helix transcriptional regulator [Enterococcus italicus]
MISLKLNELLKKREITILQLSEQTGISRSTLNSMVNGVTKGIQFTTLDTLCESLDCSVSDLIEYIPFVQYPKLFFISVEEDDCEYKIAFIYEVQGLDKTKLKHISNGYIGILLTIFVRITEDKRTNLMLRLTLMFNRDVEILISKKMKKEVFNGRIDSERRFFPIINRSIDMVLPKYESSFVDSTFKHFNLALDYWPELEEKLRREIKSEQFVVTVTFLVPTHSVIDTISNIDFTTDYIYSSTVESPNPDTINFVKKNKSEIIKKQSQSIRVFYSYKKNKEDSLKITDKEHCFKDIYISKNGKKNRVSNFKILDI